MPHIGSSSHGESRLRMLRIMRRGDRHDPKDLTVVVPLRGGLRARRSGTGARTACCRARRSRTSCTGSPASTAAARSRSSGSRSASACSARIPRSTQARVEITEQPWTRLDAGGKAQGQAFTAGDARAEDRGDHEQRQTGGRRVGHRQAVRDADRRVRAAPTRDAADDGTTDGLQRLLVGGLTARWTYTSSDVTFRPYRQGVRAAIVETFAWHASRSVQHTLYAHRRRRARDVSGDRRDHAHRCRSARTAPPISSAPASKTPTTCSSRSTSRSASSRSRSSGTGRESRIPIANLESSNP